MHRSLPMLACTALLSQGPQTSPVTEKSWRAFLRTHPHHLEARSALLLILRKDAEKRTQELMGTPWKTAKEVLREGQSGLGLKKIMEQPLPTRPRVLAPALDEALLRLGRLAEAEAMLSAWMEAGGWSGAAGEAARLARAQGLSGLAARWEGMR